MPDGDQVKRIRRAIAEQPDRFLSIIRGRAFKRRFGELEGDKLKRVPPGYDQDHSLAEWLKLKQFFVGAEWPEAVCSKRSFVDEVAKAFEEATPLVRFLNEAMG